MLRGKATLPLWNKALYTPVDHVAQRVERPYIDWSLDIVYIRLLDTVAWQFSVHTTIVIFHLVSADVCRCRHIHTYFVKLVRQKIYKVRILIKLHKS